MEFSMNLDTIDLHSEFLSLDGDLIDLSPPREPEVSRIDRSRRESGEWFDSMSKENTSSFVIPKTPTGTRGASRAGNESVSAGNSSQVTNTTADLVLALSLSAPPSSTGGAGKGSVKAPLAAKNAQGPSAPPTGPSSTPTKAALVSPASKRQVATRSAQKTSSVMKRGLSTPQSKAGTQTPGKSGVRLFGQMPSSAVSTNINGTPIKRYGSLSEEAESESGAKRGGAEEQERERDEGEDEEGAAVRSLSEALVAALNFAHSLDTPKGVRSAVLGVSGASLGSSSGGGGGGASPSHDVSLLSSGETVYGLEQRLVPRKLSVFEDPSLRQRGDVAPPSRLPRAVIPVLLNNAGSRRLRPRLPPSVTAALIRSTTLAASGGGASGAASQAAPSSSASLPVAGAGGAAAAGGPLSGGTAATPPLRAGSTGSASPPSHSSSHLGVGSSASSELSGWNETTSLVASSGAAGTTAGLPANSATSTTTVLAASASSALFADHHRAQTNALIVAVNKRLSMSAATGGLPPSQVSSVFSSMRSPLGSPNLSAVLASTSVVMDSQPSGGALSHHLPSYSSSTTTAVAASHHHGLFPSPSRQTPSSPSSSLGAGTTGTQKDRTQATLARAKDFIKRYDLEQAKASTVPLPEPSSASSPPVHLVDTVGEEALLSSSSVLDSSGARGVLSSSEPSERDSAFVEALLATTSSTSAALPSPDDDGEVAAMVSTCTSTSTSSSMMLTVTPNATVSPFVSELSTTAGTATTANESPFSETAALDEDGEDGQEDSPRTVTSGEGEEALRVSSEGPAEGQPPRSVSGKAPPSKLLAPSGKKAGHGLKKRVSGEGSSSSSFAPPPSAFESPLRGDPSVDRFSALLENALKTGSGGIGSGGSGGLAHTPPGGKREAPAGSEWSPIRKQAVSKEEEVIKCTKRAVPK